MRILKKSPAKNQKVIFSKFSMENERIYKFFLVVTTYKEH